MKPIRKRFWRGVAASVFLAAPAVCAQADPLTIRTVSVASDSRSITLSLSSGLAGMCSWGDIEGLAYFAASYRTDLIPENGRNGTFYLHPNPKGAAVLGRLWASSIADALFGGKR